MRAIGCPMQLSFAAARHSLGIASVRCVPCTGTGSNEVPDLGPGYCNSATMTRMPVAKRCIIDLSSKNSIPDRREHLCGHRNCSKETVRSCSESQSRCRPAEAARRRLSACGDTPAPPASLPHTASGDPETRRRAATGSRYSSPPPPPPASSSSLLPPTQVRQGPQRSPALSSRIQNVTRAAMMLDAVPAKKHAPSPRVASLYPARTKTQARARAHAGSHESYSIRLCLLHLCVRDTIVSIALVCVCV